MAALPTGWLSFMRTMPLTMRYRNQMRNQAPGDPARHDEQQPQRDVITVQHAGPQHRADAPGEVAGLPGARGVAALDQVDHQRDDEQRQADLRARQHRADATIRCRT